MAKLLITSGDDPQEFTLEAYNTLGRHPNNTIQVLDRIVSKEHAEIVCIPDGRYELRDLGSLNGTFMEGERVDRRILLDGDEITFGSTRITFCEQKETDRALNKVTIAPNMMKSHIRQRLAPDMDSMFWPEKEIHDEKLLRRDYERLRIAQELGRAIGNELDLDTLLQKILDKAFELLPADRGVILLMGEDGKPVPRVVKHKHSSDPDEIVLSNSIINEVIQGKQAVLSSDASMDARFSGAHSIIMQGIRSTMCVPLLHGEEILGIMNLDSQIATNAFGEKDLRIFSGIATQAAGAIQNARLAHKIEFEARTRAQFERFFSPAMVQEVVEGRLQLDGVGETRDVTILFADIRGFTSMTENVESHEIVALLNDYFEMMVEVLFQHNGTLDKYVGDEVMALFGVPVAHPDAPVAAVACAVEMQRGLEEFNRTREADGQAPVYAGIGINTGPVVYGAIGSSKTLQYTVIGDAVNTASRLCSLAGPGEVIISDTTHSHVESLVTAEELPAVRVKGKQGMLTTFRVSDIGERPPEFIREGTQPT